MDTQAMDERVPPFLRAALTDQYGDTVAGQILNLLGAYGSKG